MSIDSVKFSLPSIETANKPAGVEKAGGVQGGDKTSFGSFLKEAVNEVNDLQLQADNRIEDLVLQKGNVSTHDAMIALEKADVAFQLMNTIRGRIVRAYEEVMRTQV